MSSTAVKFVAEVSSNHNADLERSLRFVAKAAQIGCWGIKFQYFQIEKLFHESALARKPELWQRKQWELPLAHLPAIRQACYDYNIKLGVTPFHVQGVRELQPYVDFYKVASYNVLDVSLLYEISKTAKPIVLATGMATLQEIEQAIEVLNAQSNPNITLLHCVSDYPVSIYDCNLRALDTLRGYGYPVGWSDHSVNPAVVIRAIYKYQAKMVEFHLDLDGQGYEYTKGHCWLPDSAAQVISIANNAFSADGDGRKQPRPTEIYERLWRADPSDGLRPLLSER